MKPHRWCFLILFSITEEGEEGEEERKGK